MDLSVIIPTYNRSRLLARTIQGLCDQQTGSSIREVLVISDGATDDSSAVVNSFKDRLPIQYIEQPRKSVSAARNRGLAEARGTVALLLDDDIVPSPKLIAEHTAFHQQYPEIESVLLGYVTWLPELPITPFMRWYGEYGALFGYALLEDGKQVDRKYLYSCNVSFKVQFLNNISGFNENLTVFEDHELGYRLAKRGMKMFFRRNALAYHNQTFTFQQARERMRRYSRGVPAFLATEAGSEMNALENKWKMRLKRLATGPAIHALKPLESLADCPIPLPRPLYRLLYWYGAIRPLHVASNKQPKP